MQVEPRERRAHQGVPSLLPKNQPGSEPEDSKLMEAWKPNLDDSIDEMLSSTL